MKKQLLLSYLTCISAGLVSINALAIEDILATYDVDSVLADLAAERDCDPDNNNCSPDRDHWIPVVAQCNDVIGVRDNGIPYIGKKFKIINTVSCSTDTTFVGPAITVGGIANTVSMNGHKVVCNMALNGVPTLPVPDNAANSIGAHLFGIW